MTACRFPLRATIAALATVAIGATILLWPLPDALLSTSPSPQRVLDRNGVPLYVVRPPGRGDSTYLPLRSLPRRGRAGKIEHVSSNVTRVGARGRAKEEPQYGWTGALVLRAVTGFSACLVLHP